MPLLSSSRKAEEFARLLEGSGKAGSGSGDLGTLQNLAARLSSVPQPRPEFASALRERLLSEAATTLPSAAGGGAGSGGAGSGGAGSGGTGSGTSGPGAGSAGSTGSGTAGSAGSGTAGPTGSAATASPGAIGGTTAGGTTAGSALSGIVSATAPVWAQFAAGAAATVIAISGVGLGASQSLPGDPLYGVKRQIEVIQLDLAGGRTDTALAHLGFASTRLSEMADLLDGHAAGAPLSPDLQRRISTLLTDWAGETSQGTTVLLDELSSATGDAAAIRQKLTDFTESQARGFALVVQKLPDQRLQSLTGSAFAYLQRVDTALGNPVDLATLLPSLGLPLPTTTSPAATPASPSNKAGSSGASGSGQSGTSHTSPSSVPTLPIPTNGSTSTGGSTSNGSKLPSLPTVPSGGTGSVGRLGGAVGGAVGSSVGGATGGVDQTVNGVLSGVTGKGPSLPLPTSVPTVSGLSH